MFESCSTLLFLVLTLSRAASGQFIVFNGEQQIVFGARGLQQALDDASVSTIILSGNITLNSTLWSDPPPVIKNRRVLLAGDNARTSANVLNFGSLLGAIIIGEGAEVEFRNLTLSNPGPQNLNGQTVNNVNYRSSNVGAWPSLIVLDGATVIFDNCELQYYSQIAWARCANFAAKVKFQLTSVMHYPNVTILPSNNASLLLSDSFNLTSNITDINTDQIVGNVELVTKNTTMTCVPDPFPQDGPVSGEPESSLGGDSFKWWYGLIIAIGAVVLLAAITGVVLVLFLRRKQRRALLAEQAKAHFPPQPSPLGIGKSPSASEDARTASLRPSSSVPAMPDPADVEVLRSAQTSKAIQDTWQAPHKLVAAALFECNAKNELSGVHWWLFTEEALWDGDGSWSELRKSLQSAETLTSPRLALVTDSQCSEPDNTPSGLGSSTGKGSGGLTTTGLRWSDVTALLRARSDFSDLEIGPLIGRGSYGRVYKGRWKGAFVAIKIVDHQEAATKVMALREGTLSHSVQHPNVITTYSVFLQKMNTNHREDHEEWAGDRNPPEDAMEGIPERATSSFTENQEHFATCMVLEYADRGTLEKAVTSGRFQSASTGVLDLKSIHRTLLDIAGGMDYLHSVGVLHGDLKGANVLLKSTATDPRGFTCKLADFGMARVLATNRSHVSTQTYGTVSYMPAELLREGKLTRAVDSYSFAIVMWELFTGTMLHAGLTIAQVFYKVCYEQLKPPVPEGMPEEYKDLMVRCWDDDPTSRPSFSEIFESLQGMPTMRNRPSTSSASPSSRKNSGLGNVSVVHSPFDKVLPDTPQTVAGHAPTVAGHAPTVAPVPRTFPGPNPFAAAATIISKSEPTNKSKTTVVDSESSDESRAR